MRRARKKGGRSMTHQEMSDITPENQRTVSRRTFIKGVIAAGATASAATYVFRNAQTILGQPSLPGAVERLVTLTVNGQQRRVDVMKQETLATTLRYRLGVTGTKLGCDAAEW